MQHDVKNSADSTNQLLLTCQGKKFFLISDGKQTADIFLSYYQNENKLERSRSSNPVALQFQVPHLSYWAKITHSLPMQLPFHKPTFLPEKKTVICYPISTPQNDRKSILFRSRLSFVYLPSILVFVETPAGPSSPSESSLGKHQLLHFPSSSLC